MTREQIIAKLFKTVADKKPHKHYDRTVDKAKLYKRLTTGEDMDSLLKRFARREDDVAFKQRKEITQHITQSVVKNIMDVFYKIPRSNYLRILTYTNAEQGETFEIESILKKFWGNLSLDDYMATRWLELNSVDPNAFVVFEFDAFDPSQGRAQPYPFEVYSENAFDYTYENRVLQYLTVKQVKDIIDQDGKKQEIEVWTCYMKDDTIQMIEVKSDQIAISAQEGEIYVGPDGNKYTILGKKTYQFIEILPHKAGMVPAMRIGVMRDLWTDGQTYNCLYHAAMPFLMKSLKINSEMDLTMALSAFPLGIRYDENCEAQGCIKGSMPDGSTCTTCKGTGRKLRPTSAQEEIVLPMPDTPEEMFDLEKILVYKTPPVDLLKFQDEYIDKLSRRAKKIVFNSDIFDRSEIAETATGKNLDMQNAYDTLYPVARKWGRDWEYSVDVISKFTDLDKIGEGNNRVLIRNISFSDFQLKDREDLLIELDLANKSGAGTEFKTAIEGDLMRIVYRDDSDSLLKWQVKQYLNPFSGMTENQILLVMASNLAPQKVKVLYANFGYIFDELELEYAQKSKNFYIQKRSDQRKAVFEKVDQIIKETQSQIPSMNG